MTVTGLSRRPFCRRVIIHSHKCDIFVVSVAFYPHEAERVRQRGGVTYKTASQWWKAGHLDASHLPSGATMGRETKPSAMGVALYARVSSADQQEDVARQMQRLRDDAAARGDQVVAEVTEIASGLNDERPQLKQLLTDACGDGIVVESQDGLTRFGYNAIAALLERAGRRVEALSPRDTDADLVHDVVAMITRLATRLYGWRQAARMEACVTPCIEQAEQVADT
jgi:putative resolvase